MSEKKTKSVKSSRPGKAAFVRSLSTSIPAAEVVQRAKSAGLELTPDRVHKIRSAEKTRLAKSRPQKQEGTSLAASSHNSSSTAHGGKSAFVRGLPTDMPTKEVLSLAKKQGLNLSAGQVYNIRSAAKAAAKVPGGKLTKAKMQGSAPVSVASSSKLRGNANTSGHEATLRSLIADVGLARARAVIAEVSSTFSAR
jgi:hypothetical protein